MDNIIYEEEKKRLGNEKNAPLFWLMEAETNVIYFALSYFFSPCVCVFSCANSYTHYDHISQVFFFQWISLYQMNKLMTTEIYSLQVTLQNLKHVNVNVFSAVHTLFHGFKIKRRNKNKQINNRSIQVKKNSTSIFSNIFYFIFAKYNFRMILKVWIYTSLSTVASWL